VEEPLVEAIATGARAAGLWLETIAPVDQHTLTLLPHSERESRERAARRRTRRLAFATCALWLMVGALFWGRLLWERRAVERELVAGREGERCTVLFGREQGAGSREQGGSGS